MPPQPCAHAGCRELTRSRYCDAHRPQRVTLDTARTIIVCGPAGSGKSTFVREHMRDGDLIVDVDALACALCDTPIYHDHPHSLPFALMARDTVLLGLERAGRTQRAWIVAGLPRRDRRDEMRDRFNAHVIVMETPYEECVRRIDDDPRRSNYDGVWNSRVRLWWDEYRESPEDECIRPAFVAAGVL